MNQLKRLLSVAILTMFLFAGCRAPFELLETGELERAEITTDELAERVPDYSATLQALSGNGRALISQPGNSDRISIDFHSDRVASLVTFRNRLGIEGGQLLVKEDSVLIYNRIDRIAEKVALENANLTEVATLATVNIIDLFHHSFAADEVSDIFEDAEFYVVIANDGTRITIDKDTGLVRDVQVNPRSGTPYSRVSYEEYEQLNNFYLPRKITILSADAESRVTLLVRRLQANQPLPALEIQVPDDIPILVL